MTAIIVVSKDTIIASMEFIDTGHLSVSTLKRNNTGRNDREQKASQTKFDDAFLF